MKRVFIAAALAFSALGVANASIIPSFVGVTDLGGGAFSYAYDVFVEQPGQRIQFATIAGPGGVPAGGMDNHFTFWDFVGYVTGSAACTGSSFCSDFAASVAGTGPSAFLQNAPDSASVPNVTWTFTSNGTTIPGGSYLGRYTLNSTTGTAGTIYFSGQATKSTGDLNGTVGGNTILTTGPSTAGINPVPEPATMLLLGAGLIVISRSRKTLLRRR